jgi:hypothetical protein
MQEALAAPPESMAPPRPALRGRGAPIRAERAIHAMQFMAGYFERAMTWADQGVHFNASASFAAPGT